MTRMAARGRYDYTLLTVLGILVLSGLIILYSTSAYNGEVKFCDSSYYLKKQVFATCLGFLAMFFTAQLDYHRLKNIAWLCYLVALLLSIAVIFVGREYNGSKRWLALGPLSFQPSEFAKVAVILFLASYVTRNVKKMYRMRTLIKVMIVVLPIVGLVGASNLSTAIIILSIAVVLIFVASPKYGQFVFLGAAGAGFMGIFLALESYRLERLAVWKNPEAYEKGYQTLQGLYAIGSGGLFGACFILMLFLLLIWRFFVIATQAKDLFGALIASGAMAHMMIQVILNIAVVTNTIPNTGITLPFISYGGTSVVFLLVEMGLVLSVSKNGSYCEEEITE